MQSADLSTREDLVFRNVVRPLLRGFFQRLYHGLAWSYDLIAAVVSLGHWYDWTEAVLEFVRGPHILELGHGTGHLLAKLSAAEEAFAVGLDESRQMGMIALHRMANPGQKRVCLTRGLAQRLPFEDAKFDSVISTFPTEFIFNPETISEVRRVLKSGGRLVVLPAAWFAGKRFAERIAAWLFAFTRQVPTAPEAAIRARLGEPLSDSGFEVALHRIEDPSSAIMVVVATK